MAAREAFSGLIGMNEELGETGLSRINGFIGLKNVGCVAASVVATTICTSAAYADDQFSECPKIWSEYVVEVSKIAAPLHETVAIFFTSPDGLVYNCLNLIGHQEIFAEATAFAKAFPAIENPLNFIEPSDFPVGFCNITTTKRRGKVEYYSIDLPIDTNFLSNPICKKRVLGGMKFEVEGIKK
jgi:hypothetical protein